MTSANASRLMEALALSEDELCEILRVDPLTLLSGQVDHLGELPILLTLVDEALTQTTPAVLQRWLRARGPRGRPIEILLRRDFAAFEDALADLSARGFVLSRPPREGGGA